MSHPGSRANAEQFVVYIKFIFLFYFNLCFWGRPYIQQLFGTSIYSTVSCIHVCSLSHFRPFVDVIRLNSDHFQDPEPHTEEKHERMNFQVLFLCFVFRGMSNVWPDGTLNEQRLSDGEVERLRPEAVPQQNEWTR